MNLLCERGVWGSLAEAVGIACFGDWRVCRGKGAGIAIADERERLVRIGIETSGGAKAEITASLRSIRSSGALGQ